MEILIDEAGTFAIKDAPENSWCVVAAYASPETEKRKYESILKGLKRAENKKESEEIKLHQVSEKSFIQFLEKMNGLNGVLLCTATDSGLNYVDLVQKHQKTQASSMLKNIDEMKYESGKDAVRYLTSQLENLPAQLYIQLACQIQLMYSFVIRGICYFVQREPNSLMNFIWRIDQKEPHKKVDFEDAFEKFCPALLQTFSLQKPGPKLDWCDYSPMSEYMYKKGDIPDYLVDNLPHLKNSEGFDIQKIVRRDIKFIDSKAYPGIQIIDLLASGLRRLLKQEFKNNEIIARYLGGLMIQETNNNPPIELVTFGSDKKIDDSLAKIIRIMIKSCRPMIKKS
jgi:hypothetical protein